MRPLSLSDLICIHEQVAARSGGASGIRELGALQSSLALPWASFAGKDLYPDLLSKAAALCHSLVANHPFIDGNKRTAHAALETFLRLNGMRIDASVDEHERIMLGLAGGTLTRAELLDWLRGHGAPFEP